MSDEVTALQAMADRVRILGERTLEKEKRDEERYRETHKALQEFSKTVDQLHDLVRMADDFGWSFIPPKRRKEFPDIMEWWEDRLKHEKDWKYYFPIIMAFIGPIIGGIVVVLITVKLK